METAVSTLSTFNTSKDGIKRYVDQVVSEIKSGTMNALTAKIYIKSIQKSLEEIDKQISEDVMNEANKYEKRFEYRGAIVEQCEVGTKYDFSNCGDIIWDELNKQINQLTERKKEREALLKTVKQEGLRFFDESTSELWHVSPPIKTSTSGIKITIK